MKRAFQNPHPGASARSVKDELRPRQVWVGRLGPFHGRPSSPTPHGHSREAEARGRGDATRPIQPAAPCGRQAPVRGSSGAASSASQSTAQVVPARQSVDVAHRPRQRPAHPSQRRRSRRRRTPRDRIGDTRTAGPRGPVGRRPRPPSLGGSPSADRTSAARRTCHPGPAPSRRRTARARPRRRRGQPSGGRPRLPCGASRGRSRGSAPLVRPRGSGVNRRRQIVSRSVGGVPDRRSRRLGEGGCLYPIRSRARVGCTRSATMASPAPFRWTRSAS
jgi:hypothetical protein